MGTKYHLIASRAFSTPEWRSAADAFYQATGAVVSAFDFSSGQLLAPERRCGFCRLGTDDRESGQQECFDECPKPSGSDIGRVMCRAGIAVLYAPVKHADTTVAHLAVSGFVTSTRERRGLYQNMISRGATEDSARRTMKALPVVGRRQAESYLQMAVASATSIVDATAQRMIANERIEELRLFVAAGHQAVSDVGSGLTAVAEEAVALAGAEAGAILRARDGLLEVVAKTEGWRGSVGALIPRAQTAAGRAADTARFVVSGGKDGASVALAMPLLLGNRVLGILEVRLPAGVASPTQDRVARLARFGQFIAVALEREDERAAVERAMTGYSRLNRLASSLGAQTDVEGVVDLVTDVIEETFSHQLAGLIVHAWGKDRAELLVGEGVTHADISHVIDVVSGRNIDLDPYVTKRMRGEQPVAGPEGENWAIGPVRLAYGELDVGWLFVARKDGQRWNRQDEALLEGIAAHAGAALGRAALFTRIRDDYAKTIAALSATLDYGERAPKGHASRVMDYSMLIGEELDLPFEQVEMLRFAGLLHDIGKTGVPEEILLKPSSLTGEELEQVQLHAQIGASIVDQIEFLKSLTPIILHHHERWDGQGYPQGLAGDSIPVLARVLAVADAFDAMMTSRTYRKRLTIAQARAELERSAGTQFDPRVVAALFESLDRQALAGGSGLFASPDAGRHDLPV